MQTLLSSTGASSLCAHRCALSGQLRQPGRGARPLALRVPGVVRAQASEKEAAAASTSKEATSSEGTSQTVEVNVSSLQVDKEVTKFARNAATTFAPRASGAVKNPAIKGTALYTVFTVQAWVCLAIGGLLSFNLLFPSNEPDIWRLMGMWSIWMFTIPSLRARDCTQTEKDALNLLFLLVPLINVGLPFVWKSFPFIYTADCLAMAAVYSWKGLIPGVNQQEE